MAFHFNWSPLIADTDRVRHMLTSSLNKSPKPPIIVDDIVVNELNLGSNPPSLEILEIGDLAEDRFRGIFKVRYEGDAYLTLRTKVQANPLNTFLSTKPSFASPAPLAAGSGLTIPLQITLSDIRLSGFVILVFSKQKGITLVFRNDPLESLKVSSTFDSIPFVRDYLQRTIEGQLRVLFMEDLPAIIHRLSLRVFSEEYQGQVGGGGMFGEEEEGETAERNTAQAGAGVDGFGSPGQSATDDDGLVFPFSLDTQGETYASFSQKNLVRLAALSESQRTLSLFTPTIRDTVYRAWASAADRNSEGTMPLHHKPPATLSRIQSTLNMQHSTQTHPHPHAPRPSLSSAASFASDAAPSHATRPSLASYASMPSTYSSLGSGRPRGAHGQRKRKNRVVNLRRQNTEGGTDGVSDTVTLSSEYDDSASRSESISASGGSTGQTGMVSPEMSSTVPTSVMQASSIAGGAKEGEVQTPRSSPQRQREKRVGFQRTQSARPADPVLEKEGDAVAGAESEISIPKARPRKPVTPRQQHSQPHLLPAADFEGGDGDNEPTPRASMYLPHPASTDAAPPQQHPRRQHQPTPASKPPPLPRSSSELSISDLLPSYPFADGAGGAGGSSGGILEQAWMTKMAREIARRVAEERGKAEAGEKGEGFERAEAGLGEGEEAPPAYVG